MKNVIVVSLVNTTAEERERIKAVDSRIEFIDAGSWFDEEMCASWPEFTVQRYLANSKPSPVTRDQRDEVLAKD